MSKQECTLPKDICAKPQMNSSDKYFFIAKVVLVTAIYIFLILNTFYDFAAPDYVPECVRDEMHELTLPINQYLNKNKFYKDLLIIVSSLMIDINVFVLASNWIFYGKNYKLLTIIAAFYMFRGFLQSVFFINFPNEYLWSHPGLFSITVPYNPTNDFFYSGHLGLCTICFVQFKREGKRFMKNFAFITIVIEFFALLVTRAHYFIDLVSGIIIAHYIFLVSDWIYEYIELNQKTQAIQAADTVSNSLGHQKESPEPINSSNQMSSPNKN